MSIYNYLDGAILDYRTGRVRLYKIVSISGDRCHLQSCDIDGNLNNNFNDKKYPLRIIKSSIEPNNCIIVNKNYYEIF